MSDHGAAAKKEKKDKKHFLLSPNVLFQKVMNTAGAAATTAGAVVTAPMSVIPGINKRQNSKGVIDEKEDDDVKEEKFGTTKGLRHLRNIFAIPFQHLTEKKGEFHLQSYEHTSEQTAFIKEHLHDHYLFDSMPEKELNRVAAAFELYELPASTDDVALIQQGEWVTEETGYFYLLYKGRCEFIVNNEIVGDPALPGDCFGELALLYNCPRAATVKALTSLGDVKLFRIHQRSFRCVLQNENEQADQEKLNILDNIAFINQITNEQRSKLAQAMQPLVFEKGDYIVKLNDPLTSWYIVKHGEVRLTNLEQSKYEDIVLKDGDCFAELMIHLDSPVCRYDAIADTDGLAFTIDKNIFKSVLGGDVSKYVYQSSDYKRLKGVKVFMDSIPGDQRTLSYLVTQIKNSTYQKGDEICREGYRITNPSFYLVRRGKIQITQKDGKVEVIEQPYFFGDDQLYYDTKSGGMFAKYTATVITDDCELGELKLAAFRKVMNTKKMGQVQSIHFDSLKVSGSAKLSLNDVERHQILGAGTFGQVWLVSRKGTDGTKHAYALKIQSKYELIQNGQARGVVYEKNVMEKLQHPFVGGLVASFKDDNFVYMLMPLIQGGELYSVMNVNKSHKMNESDAMFYIAAIAEGLTYMHRHGFVYRDLKPENVLIDADGYPIIVDFGFAKYVLDKTFTLCGTPLYIAPEVILNRGHNYGADHWSLGCLIYEMLEGCTPFYTNGMDQTQLMRAIVKGDFPMPPKISPEAKNIIQGLLTRNPDKRLGNISGGLDGLLYHPWLCHLDHDNLLLKEIKAPIVPNIKDAFDGSNFEDWSNTKDKAQMHYPALSQSQNSLFNDF